MSRWLTTASLVIVSLVLAVAGGCGDDDDDPDSGPEVSPFHDSGSETVPAGVTIYHQEVEYNGVRYTCLLAGYGNYPGLWCERQDEGVIE